MENSKSDQYASNQGQQKTYHVLGVPSAAGSLFSGTEFAARVYREVQFIERLREEGRVVIDEGDVAIPSYLPRHSIPPIRNWPAPRIVWEQTDRQVRPLLKPGQVALLIGGDCSIVVGTVQAMVATYGRQVHVISVDAHIDAAAPDASSCRGAAAMGLWMISNQTPFWDGTTIDGSQITVIGWTDANAAARANLQAISLGEVRQAGIEQAARQVLETIDANAAILLHFDVDVLDEQDMPDAYSPTTGGMRYAEVEALLRVMLADARVRAVEVTEYFPLRDSTQSSAQKIVKLFAATLPAPSCSEL